jgi:DeoR family transcriptional regulator, catabolite repression regulator
MPLNERQIRILRAIEQGNITGDSIAKALDSSMQMLRYYLDTMVEDGYLKAARVYDNDTREFQIVRAYLTDKGKAELEQMPESNQSFISMNSASQSSSKSEVNQISIYELHDVLKSLEVLLETVEQLPEARRELAIVYFNDLQDEIKIVYRRKHEKIKAYFIAVLGMILPVSKQINHADDFFEAVRNLSKKLNVPVKLPQSGEEA